MAKNHNNHQKVLHVPKPDWLKNLFLQHNKLSKISKAMIFMLLLVLYSAIILHKFQLPAALDLPRFLTDGQQIVHHGFYRTNMYSYTETNRPVVNSSWLCSVIFFLIYKIGGFVALSIFGWLMLLAAFSILFYVALKFADFYLVALLSIPAILIIGIRPDVRPEIFSYLCFSLFLLFLYNFKENPNSKKIWWLVPIQIIWANTHLFFALGPAMVAGFLIEHAVLNYRNIKSDPQVKKLSLLLLALTAACFINPYGLAGTLDAYSQWKATKGFPVQIQETTSIKALLNGNPVSSNITIELYKPVLIVLAASFVVGFQKKRRPVFLLLISAGAAIFGYSVLRGLALFGFVFLLAAAVNFNGLFLKAKSWLLKKVLKPEAAIIMVLVFFIVTTVYLSGYSQRKSLSGGAVPGIGLAPGSDGGANFFKDNNLSGPVFNDADIGSYLIFYLYPGQKVYSDNRFFVGYSGQVFDQFNADISDKNAWLADLKRYNFNTIFFYQYSTTGNSFINDRLNDPNWALVYADRYSVIMVRNTAANQTVIKKYKITPQNVQDRVRSLASSNDPNDQIAAADILSTVGRSDLAFTVNSGVVARWPDYGGIWFALGSWEVINANGSLVNNTTAIDDIQKAINEGYKTADAYTYLGIAEYNIYQRNNALQAAKKALKINPTNQDAKTLLDTINKN